MRANNTSSSSMPMLGTHRSPPSPVLARLRRDTDPHDLGKLVVRLATLAAQAHTMMMANEEQPQFDATRIAPLPFSGPADTTDQDDPGGGHAA
ncbi:MAG: hypothetical protein HND57_04225 [Planctomycetes bacterium]|nr:hypothetical protein [Planctomycetota bacterium]